MDDADSGICQSRTDSFIDSGDTYSSSTAIEDAKLSDGDSYSSSIGELSSIDDGDITSSSYSFNSEDESRTPPSLAPQLPKKKLSLSDSFLSSSIDKVGFNNKLELLPGMKVTYKEGEREEKWEFSSSQPCKVEYTTPSHSQQLKSGNSSSKKILKLRLSTSPSEQLSQSDDTHTPSPEVPYNEFAQVNTTVNSVPELQDSDDSDPESFQSSVYLELRDPNKTQCSEWRRSFNDEENVTVQCREFFSGELDYDAVVVPGNSFGYLDGEPEIRFTEKFGWQIQKKVQRHIYEVNDGEMLVGDSVTISLEDNDFGHNTGVRYAIYVPVMRVPLQVGDTVNAYLAFRAAMRAVRRHNERCCPGDEISTILCPSLCNGYGGMSSGRIAHQMKEAYKTILHHNGKLQPANGLGTLATHHVDMTSNSGNWC